MSGNSLNQSDAIDSVTKVSRAIELERRKKKDAAGLVSIFTVFAFGVAFGLLFSEDLARFLTSSERTETIQRVSSNIKIVSAFLGLISMGIVSYFFASGAHRSLYSSRSNIDGVEGASEIKVDVLVSAVEDIARASREIRENRNISEEDYNVIQEKIEETVKKALPVELVRGLEGKYGRSIKGDLVAEYMNRYIVTIKSRLSAFSEDLSNKAAVSLVWGLVTAVAGIGLLALFVWVWNIPENTSQADVVGHYVMRVGLVALIEGIAIFFLKQYRLNLIDVKYVQNEITNVEIRFAAAVSAIRIDGDRAASDILPRLADTERNFILKKGESSIFMGLSDKEVGLNSSLSSLYARLADLTRHSSKH